MKQEPEYCLQHQEGRSAEMLFKEVQRRRPQACMSSTIETSSLKSMTGRMTAFCGESVTQACDGYEPWS